MKKQAALVAATAALTMACMPSVIAAGDRLPPPTTYGNIGPVGGVIPTAPIVHHIPVPVIPPQQISTPTPTSSQSAPFVPVLPNNQYNAPLATDLTHENIVMPQPLNQQGLATNGIENINDDLAFKPSADPNDDGILIRTDDNTVWQRTSATSAKLTEGTLLVSVRHPSKGGLIDTPDGLIALRTDGDLLISYVAGVLRVDNISARWTRCKIQLANTVVAGKKAQVALAPGFELVASDHKLLRGEVRPPDGIARRSFSLVANGHIAVNEFSVDSVLASSAIIASMVESDSKQESHVLHDMCKMAAVLNYVNGPNGYTTSGNAGIATKPGAGTQ